MPTFLRNVLIVVVVMFLLINYKQTIAGANSLLDGITDFFKALKQN